MVGLTKDTASHTIVRHIACASLNSSDLHSPGSHGCSFSESSPGASFLWSGCSRADWPEGFDRSIRQIATACRENHSVQSPFFSVQPKDRQRRHSPVILAVRRHRGHFSRCNLKELRPPSWATGRLRALYEVQEQASRLKPGPPRRMAVLIYDAASRPPYPEQKVSAERGLGGTARPFLALDGPTKQDASLLRPSHLTIPHHTTIDDHKRGLSVPDCENNCTHSTAASPTSLARHSARRSPPGAPDSAC